MEEMVWDGTEEGIPSWAKSAGWALREVPAWRDWPAHVVAERAGDPGSDVLCHQIYRGDTFTRSDVGEVWAKCIKGRSLKQCAEDSRL